MTVEKETPLALAGEGARDGIGIADELDDITYSRNAANDDPTLPSYRKYGLPDISVGMTRDALVRKVTECYISDVRAGVTLAKMKGRGLANRELATTELIQRLRGSIEKANGDMLSRTGRFKVPSDLEVSVVAMMMVAFEGVRRVNVNPAGDGGLKLGVYDGQGVYNFDITSLYKVARAYNSSLRKYIIDDDLVMQLNVIAPVLELTADPDLIPFENGMFDYRTKVLLPYDDPAFDPDVYVFAKRSHVNMPDKPHNAVYTTKQGVNITGMSWFDTLFDVPDRATFVNDESYEAAVASARGRRNLVKQMVCASLRPNVRWNMSFILYDRGGSAGKGTLCELMESLVGAGSYKSIPLALMASTHAMEGIEHVQLITGHENAVSGYLDDLTVFKMLVTGDAVLVNPKNKPMYTARFRGLIVECCNALPKVSDKTGSFWRRLCFIPFDKSFKGDADDRNVKDKFLKDPLVLEDIVFGLMHDLGDFYGFDVPECCSEAMHETVRANSSAAAFFYDCFTPDGEGWHGCWEAYSIKMHLWPAYYGWYMLNYPSSSGMLSYQNFRKELIEYVNAHPEFGWEAPDNAFVYGERGGDLRNNNKMLKKYTGQEWPDPPNKDLRIRGIRMIASEGGGQSD